MGGTSGGGSSSTLVIILASVLAVVFVVAVSLVAIRRHRKHRKAAAHKREVVAFENPTYGHDESVSNPLYDQSDEDDVGYSDFPGSSSQPFGEDSYLEAHADHVPGESDEPGYLNTDSAGDDDSFGFEDEVAEDTPGYLDVGVDDEHDD